MIHTPVLLTETLAALQVQPSKWYVDATFGGGGHTQAILNAGGKVVAFDHDQAAIENGEQTFQAALSQKKLILVRENFVQLQTIITRLQNADQVEDIYGILFDFGTSADQLTDRSRGFSFDSDTELDMRMDDRLGVKAKDLLALLSERQLSQVFREYGGESDANRIAKAIVISRKQGKPIRTTAQLSNLIQEQKHYRGRIHQATKVFQALRIVVNDELTNIQQALPAALASLTPHGRIITISFHEGEDRLAKELFTRWEEQRLGTKITQKPISPTDLEITNNPRSRSAKMRVFEKK